MYRSAALKRREERKRKREEEKAAAEARARAPTEAKPVEAEPTPVKLEEGNDVAPLKEEPEAAGAEPEPAHVKEVSHSGDQGTAASMSGVVHANLQHGYFYCPLYHTKI